MSLQTDTTIQDMANVETMFNRALQQLNMLQKVINKRVSKDLRKDTSRQSESKRIKEHFKKQYLERLI